MTLLPRHLLIIFRTWRRWHHLSLCHILANPKLFRQEQERRWPALRADGFRCLGWVLTFGRYAGSFGRRMGLRLRH
jgi:hypothetical protein